MKNSKSARVASKPSLAYEIYGGVSSAWRRVKTQSENNRG